MMIENSNSSSTVGHLTGTWDWRDSCYRDTFGVERFQNWKDGRIRRQRLLRNQDLEADMVRTASFLMVDLKDS